MRVAVDSFRFDKLTAHWAEIYVIIVIIEARRRPVNPRDPVLKFLLNLIR